MAFVLWIVALIATFSLRADCTFSDKTPPQVHVQRNWNLPESLPAGKFVDRVRVQYDGEVTYGLELISISGGTPDSPKSFPFKIDPITGEVKLNQSLTGRTGQNINLYVTVSDGQLTTKTEIFVTIVGASSQFSDRLRTTRMPFAGALGPSGIRTPNFQSLKPLFPAPPPASQNHRQSVIGKQAHVSNFTSSQTTNSSNDNESISIASTVPTPKVTNSFNQDWPFIFLPIIIICVLILGLGLGAWSIIKYRACISKYKKTQTKKHTSLDTIINPSKKSNSMLKRCYGLKVFNSRLEEWENETQESSKNQWSDEFEFPRHRLKVFNILGEGCFGQVWKCEAIDINGCPGPTIVAVKTLKENASERERIDLAQELKVMKNLEPHPHVVRLLGCCTDRDPIFVILEYVSGGKLQSFLRASREERNQGRPGLTSRDLTGFVYQVAKAMDYLTSKGIIHRDLAARNVLIDENRVCKVADFGFARDVADNQIYERKSEGRLPIRWMAPESLYDNIFSVKSDIWSFGVLIWEIVTLGSTPYPGLAAAEVMRKIKEGYRLDRPEHCKRELYNVMYYCWDKDPAARPSFSELVNLAEGLLLDETDYIELDRFPDHSYYNVLNLSGEKL